MKSKTTDALMQLILRRDLAIRIEVATDLREELVSALDHGDLHAVIDWLDITRAEWTSELARMPTPQLPSSATDAEDSQQ